MSVQTMQAEVISITGRRGMKMVEDIERNILHDVGEAIDRQNEVWIKVIDELLNKYTTLEQAIEEFEELKKVFREG